MSTQWKGLGCILFLIILVVPIGTAQERDDLEVLVVDSSVASEKALADAGNIADPWTWVRDRYTEPLDQMGAEYDIYWSYGPNGPIDGNVSSDDVTRYNPPSLDRLKQYDIVIWFTGKNDEGSQGSCDETSMGPDSSGISCPVLEKDEIENVIQPYLKDHDGRLFLSGQRIDTALGGREGNSWQNVFYRDYLRAESLEKTYRRSYEFQYERPEKPGHVSYFRSDPLQGQDEDIHHQGFWYCTEEEEIELDDDHCDTFDWYWVYSPVEAFRGSAFEADPIELVKTIDDEESTGNEQIRGGLYENTDVNTSIIMGQLDGTRDQDKTYKHVYFAGGLEALYDEGGLGEAGGIERSRFLNRTIDFLAGPETYNVEPEDRYISQNEMGSVSVSAQCSDMQYQGDGLQEAAYVLNSSQDDNSDILQNPRAGRGTKIGVNGGDFSFELDFTDPHSSHTDPNADTGVNVTVGVQCQDKNAPENGDGDMDGYWGQYETTDIVVDQVRPEELDGFTVGTAEDGNLTGSTVTEATLVSDRFKEDQPDFVRFSCDTNDWTSWRSFDKQEGGATQTYDVDIENQTCGMGEGKRTVYVQLKDRAGNKKPASFDNDYQPVFKDTVWLDTTDPTLQGVTPNNDTVHPANGTRINATDNFAGFDALRSEQQFYSFPNLVGYWTFEDGRIQDWSGYENDATKYGDPGVVEGTFDDALRLDGVDDNVTVPHDSSLEQSDNDEVTVAAWVKKREDLTDREWTEIVQKSDYSYNMQFNYGNPVFTINDGTTGSENNYGWQTAYSDLNTAVGEWYHYAGTFNGSHVKVYVNGEHRGTTTAEQISPSGAEDSGDVRVGIGANDRLQGSARHCPCDIDSVAIYRNALGAEDIGALARTSPRESQSFTLDSFFSPQWPSTGPNRMDVIIEDTTTNRIDEMLSYVIDPDPPHYETSIANKTTIGSEDDIDIRASEPVEGSVVEWASWWLDGDASNTTFDSDPGGMTETTIDVSSVFGSVDTYNLNLWINDSASNVNRSTLVYAYDDVPPAVTDERESNESSLKTLDPLRFVITDTGNASISSLQYDVENGNDRGFNTGEVLSIEWPGTGWQQIDLIMEDSVGNQETVRYEYFIDDLSPDIAAFEPISEQVAQDAQITIDVTDTAPTSGLTKVVFNDGTGNATLMTRADDQDRSESTDSTFSTQVSPDWPEGRITVTAWANDTVGQVTDRSRTYTVDGTPPVIAQNTGFSPVPGSHIGDSDPITYSSTVFEDEIGADIDPVGMADIQTYEVDGQNTSYNFADGESITPAFAADGNRTITFWINDSVGNLKAYDRYYIRDTQDPIINETKEANESYINSQTELRYNVKDEIGDPDVDPAGFGAIEYNTGEGNISLSRNNASFGHGWTSGETTGAETLRLWFRDAVGNWNHQNYTYYVDDAAPTTTASVGTYTFDTWTADNTIDIGLTCDDGPYSDDTCQQIDYCVFESDGSCGSESTITAPAEGTEEDAGSAGCSEGETCEYWLEYSSIDDAGNVESTNRKKIKIDREAPNATIDAPTENAIASGTITFETNITDRGAGVVADSSTPSYEIINATEVGGIEDGSVLESGTLEPGQDTVRWDSTGTIDQSTPVRFVLTAEDDVNNAAWSGRNITVDNDEPEISLTSPTVTYTNTGFDVTSGAERPGAYDLLNHSIDIVGPSGDTVYEESVSLGSTSQDTIDTMVDLVDDLGDGDGTYTITAEAYDTADPRNRAENTTTITVDTVTPTVSLDTLVNGTMIGLNSQINISAEPRGPAASPIDAVNTVFTNLSDGSTFDAELETEFGPPWDTGSNDGTDYKFIEVAVPDEAGNTNTTTYGFIYDAERPDSDLTRPAEDYGSWYGSNISLTVGTAASDDITVSDNMGVASFEYCVIDTGRTCSSYTTIDAGTFPTTFEIGCGEGNVCEYDLKYRTIDDAGNQETTQSSTFKIDKEPPSVIVSNPDSNEITGGTVQLLSNIDDGDGVGLIDNATRPEYELLNWTNQDGGIFETGSLNQSSGWDFEWTSTDVIDINDDVRYVIEAQDHLGNQNRTEHDFIIDNAAPVVDIIAPADPYYSTNLSYDVVAERPGEIDLAFHNYTLYSETIDSGNIEEQQHEDLSSQSVSQHSFEGTFNVTGTNSLTDGEYILQTYAGDGEADEDDAETQTTFAVDTVPPAISLDTPANQSYLNATDSIDLTVQPDGPEASPIVSENILDIDASSLNVDSDEPFTAPWSGQSTSNTDYRYLNVSATDQAGNWRQELFGFIYDTEDPQSTFDRPAPTYEGERKWYSGPVSVSIGESGTDSVIEISDNIEYDSFSYCISSTGNDCERTNTIDSASISSGTTITIDCPAGQTCNKVLRYAAHDRAGNEESEHRKRFNIDRKDPSIDIDAPASGSINTGDIVFDANLTDSDTGIDGQTATFEIINASTASGGGEDGSIFTDGSLIASNGWNVTWSSGDDVDYTDEARFNVTTEDEAGNWESATLTITVDNGEPVVVANQPSETYYNETIPLNSSATRPGRADLQNHTYTVYDGETVIASGGQTGLATSDHELTDTITDLPPDGDYTVNYTAFDSPSPLEPRFGTASETFTVDTDAPTFDLESPENWNAGTITLSYNITDDEQLASCEAYVRDTAVSSDWQSLSGIDCGTGETLTIDTEEYCTDTDTEACELQLRAQDRAGNTNQTMEGFNVDNVPPEVDILDLEPGSWQNASFTFTFNRTNPEGIDGAQYRVTDDGDTGTWQTAPSNSEGTSEHEIVVTGECGTNGDDTCDIEVNATNMAGLSSSTSTAVSIDTETPDFGQIDPGENANITSDEDLSLFYSDAYSGVDLDESSINHQGVSNRSLLAGDYDIFPGEIEFDPAMTQHDVYTVTFWLHDVAGNVNRTTRTYNVDNVNPSLITVRPTTTSGTGLVNDTNISAFNDDIFVSFNDDYTGVQTAEYNLGPGFVDTVSNESSIDPGWDDTGTESIAYRLTDYASNQNVSVFEYFVDADRPQIIQVSPAPGSIIRPSSITIDTFDPSLEVEDGRIRIENAEWTDLTINGSTTPAWQPSDEGERTLEVQIEDTVDNKLSETITYTVDNSTPNIDDIDLNTTTIAENDVIGIDVTASDDISAIEAVNATVYDASDAVHERLSFEEQTDIWEASIAGTAAGYEEYRLSVKANDTVSLMASDETTFFVDNRPPSLQDVFVNDRATDDEPQRIFTEDTVSIALNISDETGIADAKLTWEAPGGDRTNLSLVANDGNWTGGLTGTDDRGVYHLDTVWMEDELGNRKNTSIDRSFRAVEPTMTLNETDPVDAGTSIPLEAMIDFNRSYTGDVTFDLPVDSDGVPTLRNSSNSSCTSCTVSVVDGYIDSIDLSVDETENASIDGNFDIYQPEKDTNETITTTVGSFSPEANLTVQTPRLNVSAVGCGTLGTACTIDQYSMTDIVIEASNEQTNDHTGDAFNVTADVRSEGVDVDHDIGDITSGTADTRSATVNATVAGNHTLNVSLQDERSNYHAFRIYDFNVTDTLKPSIQNVDTPSIVNLGSTVNLSVEADDNIGVTTVNATIEYPTETGTDSETVTLSQDDDRFTAPYQVDHDGIYNVTTVRAWDARGNERSIDGNESFEVIELEVEADTSINPHAYVEDTVTVSANVSGNATAINDVIANVTRPRGSNEVIPMDLMGQTSDGWEYQTTYTNTTTSGTFNISVEAQSSVNVDAFTVFDVRYGNISVTSMHGDDAIDLPATSQTTVNLSWLFEPVQGDVQNLTASIQTGTGLSSSGEKDIGDVYWTDGAEQASWETTVQTDQETTSSVSATGDYDHPSFTDTERTSSLQVNIVDSTEPPTIETVEPEYEQVNRNRSLAWEITTDSPTVIDRATLITNHDGTRQETELERIARGTFTGTIRRTEIGTHNATVEIEDVFGNTVTSAITQFEVLDEYDVSIETDEPVYNREQPVGFDVTVQDVNGNPVEQFNTSINLSAGDTLQQTVLSNEPRSSASYFIRSTDPPTVGDGPRMDYTAQANVSDGLNTGNDTHTFEVSRILDIEFIDPSSGVSIGESFDTRIRVQDQQGTPITGRFPYVVCTACEQLYQTLSHEGNGIYSFVDGFVPSSDLSQGEDFLLLAYASWRSNRQQNGPGGTSTITQTVSIGNDGGNNTGGTGGGGSSGGGGGSIPPARLSINQRAPPPNDPTLPSDTDEATISVQTDREAECRYASNPIPGSVPYEAASPMETTDGAIHNASIPVEEGSTYQYFIMCQSEDLQATSDVIISVESEEISDYSLNVPSNLPDVQQGETTSGSVTIGNNGTEPINITLRAFTECCEAWFSDDGEEISDTTIGAGSELTFDLQYDVPLHVEPDTYSIGLLFDSPNRVRERSVTVRVQQSDEITRLQDLQQRSDRLEQDIQEYREAGLDTAELEQQYQDLQSDIEYAQTAIENDDRIVFSNTLEEATRSANNIEGQLRALSFQRYVLENWWKWLVGFIVFYVAFFLITMVAVPYYRVRSDYRNVQNNLQTAIDARKKAEKQYFRREIDRDTFMEIMTERQDEILEYRSQHDELEQKVGTVISQQLTLENFLKAPFKSIREISRWLEARRQGEAE